MPQLTTPTQFASTGAVDELLLPFSQQNRARCLTWRDEASRLGNDAEQGALCEQARP